MLVFIYFRLDKYILIEITDEKGLCLAKEKIGKVHKSPANKWKQLYHLLAATYKSEIRGDASSKSDAKLVFEHSQ